MELQAKTRNLAEDCYKIRLADFGKKLLDPINNDKVDESDRLYDKENNALKGKEGSFVVKNGVNTLYVFYSIDVNKTPKELQIKFQKKESGFDGTCQNFKLDEDVASYGIRPFLRCECGNDATVLYKPPNEHCFKCRRCYKITYDSQRLNKHTMGGLIYHTHKLIKLMEMEEKVKNKFYRGKLSRKFLRFTYLRHKWDRATTEDMVTKAKIIFNAESMNRA